MYKGSVAVYKGLKVIVYTVDKAGINLAHQDLVELINVSNPLLTTLEVRMNN